MYVFVGAVFGCLLTIGGVAWYDSLRKPYERPLVNWEKIVDRR